MVKLRGEDLFLGNGFHCGETLLRTDDVTFEHTHDFYELFLVTNGHLAHLVNGSEQLLNEGSLCLVNPEDIHRFRRAGDKGARFVNLAFSAAWHERALALCGEDAPPPEARLARLPAPTSRALEVLMEPLAGGVGAKKRPLRPALLAVLLCAMSHLGTMGPSSADAPLWLTAAMQALRSLPHQDQTIENLVRLCGHSQEHVGRVLRHCHGVTPSEYVNALRLNGAARLLKASELSILEIQLECGFESTSHFNQRFKREFALSPSQYRKRNRALINP